mmetsp:Transcript_34929/g.88212  ORF Transcript_34929/g.88212 Transcript_34929/m.88212 type:complete len:175 (+) Transcript_34929:687-1211(+)
MVLSKFDCGLGDKNSAEAFWYSEEYQAASKLRQTAGSFDACRVVGRRQAKGWVYADAPGAYLVALSRGAGPPTTNNDDDDDKASIQRLAEALNAQGGEGVCLADNELLYFEDALPKADGPYTTVLLWSWHTPEGLEASTQHPSVAAALEGVGLEGGCAYWMNGVSMERRATMSG